VAAQSEASYGLGQLESEDRRFESGSRHRFMSAFFCVVLSCQGRGLEMGRSPAQGVPPRRLKGFIVSEVISDSEKDMKCGSKQITDKLTDLSVE